MAEQDRAPQERTPPPQRQSYPGDTDEMWPQPRDEMRGYVRRGLLAGRRALVTGLTLPG